jgi:luciferase family oxidoreductase group 1
MDFSIFDEFNAVEGQEPAAVYEAHLRQIVRAEELGYHSYWFAEHHFSEHRMSPCPNVLLAAAARQTSRILLGNMVNVLPFHNPVRLAQECAMLDHLTEGRLQVGIGRGVQPLEFKRFDVDMAKSREMFIESAAMLQQIWTERGASTDGEFWRYEDVTIMPPVLQKPHPPLWFTGLSKESMLWAAEKGLPFATAFSGPDEAVALGREYRSLFQPSPTCPEPHFTVMRHLYVSDSMESAREEVGGTYNRLFGAWLDVALTDEKNVPKSYKDYPGRHAKIGAMNLDELIGEGIILFGGPEDVDRQLRKFDPEVVDMMMLWTAPQDVPPALVERCLEIFSSEVKPAFTTAAASVPG